ncbi:hypothetical protein ACFFU8_09165 [Chromobacterium piscinae]|uniref:hypothetical protein n=1 Tax=Chromobacterium piscinae TaxID=686831 RepID=UPI001E5E5522|nr:hypothetical protein [Chromobacterium piscinae]MCD5327927.1 hypothetical protein [Chromobacterium piscinae]
MKRILMFFFMLSVGQVVSAAGRLACSPDFRPVIQDAVAVNEPGQPGLVFVGMHSPDQRTAYFLNLQGGWDAYQGGLYQPAARYDAGLPSSYPLTRYLPGTPSYTSAAFQGWTIYLGYGVLTPKAQGMVKTRRDALNQLRPERVAQGKWNPEYDSDDRFKLSLIQKDLMDNQKYVKSMVIPYLDCSPPDHGK